MITSHLENSTVLYERLLVVFAAPRSNVAARNVGVLVEAEQMINRLFFATADEDTSLLN